MARFTRILTSKEFVELKPYIKYLHQDSEVNDEDFEETFKALVHKRYIFRTPAIRNIAERYIADKGATNLPKCLIV